MSEQRASAARRLATRLFTTIVGLRYIECTRDVKLYQRRLSFLRQRGVHMDPRQAQGFAR